MDPAADLSTVQCVLISFLNAHTDMFRGIPTKSMHQKRIALRKEINTAVCVYSNTPQMSTILQGAVRYCNVCVCVCGLWTCDNNGGTRCTRYRYVNHLRCHGSQYWEGGLNTQKHQSIHLPCLKR